MNVKRFTHCIILLALTSILAGCPSPSVTPTATPAAQVTPTTAQAAVLQPETATVAAAAPTGTPIPAPTPAQTPLRVPPFPPGGVQATRGGSYDELLFITWNPSAGAESYQLSLLLCAAEGLPQPLTTSVDRTTYAVQDWGDCQVPSNGEIRACNAAGCSSAAAIPWPEPAETRAPGETEEGVFPDERTSDLVALSIEGGHGSTHAIGDNVQVCYSVKAKHNFYLKTCHVPIPETGRIDVCGPYSVLKQGSFAEDRTECLDVTIGEPEGYEGIQIEVWSESALVDVVELWVTVATEISGKATEVVEAPTDTPTAAPTKPPSIPVLRGRIAFAAFDPERQVYDIYIASPDGSNMQRVIEEASQPALSPSGQQMALRRWKKDDRGLEVMDTTGGNLKRLVKFFEDGLPSWSPDGKTLVFFSRRESDRKVRVYAVDVAGGPDRELWRGDGPVYGEYPTWMPDGRIVYRAAWPERGLAVMNSDGGGGQLIVSDATATAPAVSPDGQHIAFMSQSAGNWEIYRGNANGLAISRLTTNAGNDGLPAWSPDGRTIAFVSDRDGSWAMWAMNSDGSWQRKLFDLPGGPDGLVRGEPDYSSRGWVEERISWGP